MTVVAGLFDSEWELHFRHPKRCWKCIFGIRRWRLSKTPGWLENFSVAPGRYFVRVVVRDLEGKTMAARNAGVEIP